MINFDQFRIGRVVTTGMTIAAAAAMIAILPACSPEENPSATISSPGFNPTANPVSSPIPNKTTNLAPASLSPEAIASPTPIAKTSIPLNPESSPNSTLDYGRKTFREYWFVTDPDPKGLNCRWSPAMPKDWANPSAKLPRLNIQEWPVVRQFPKNTELKANSSPAGFITMADENGKPWLKVSIGDNDQICLVRANSQFVQPK